MEENPYGTIVIFPHTFIDATVVKKISGLFEQIQICQPYYMPEPVINSEKDEIAHIKVVYPPDSFKPPENFKRLLAEFRQWIRQNPDSGYQSFYKASHHGLNFEDTLWNLRQAIRKTELSSQEFTEDEILKWHLILHLARELEENQAGADALLKQVAKHKAPLEEALDEGNPFGKGLFEEMALSETNRFIERHLLKQILQAWIGLFIKQLSKDPLLCTFDQQVFTLITERFNHSNAIFKEKTKHSHFQRNISKHVHITGEYLNGLIKVDKVKDEFNLSPLTGKSILYIEHKT